MRYKFVDHMADVEYIAYGKDTEELFANALLALFDTIADVRALERQEGKRLRVTVKEKADTLEELLWYTLQHTLSIVESRRVFAYEVAAIKINETEGGFFCETKIYAKEKKDEYSKLSVKGVSRYELKISDNPELQARVVVDV